MGGLARHLQEELRLPHGGVQDLADAAGGVQYKAKFGLELGGVQMQGALHADLFTYREEHLHPRVPGAGCLDPAQAVQNGGHAGEVVGGQDRGAVGDDLSIPDPRLDAEAVLDPVHVGRQQD